MVSSRHRLSACAAALVALVAAADAGERYGIGRPATQAEIAAWDIDIDRDGRKLPPGRGSVAHGREVFDTQCASCHGERGEGGIGDRLVGGQGSLASGKPVKTVGSFWPYAPTLFDYIRRAMPLNAPQSLSDDDVYAVSAYILKLNGLVPDDAVLDPASLARIRMPNRDGFVPDPRPDVHRSNASK
ncbi:c-type cytochrome [Methylobacterium nodulans]|uniref:Cytochrome c class I n=1 Tax=Methylobacterium nodulans (strain LMG 21967 / CNCM I-2342 / ORS 2060) TaxID=460265 RepID=B8IWF3_METNO|nr:cytochrome c [Methylobacterium nodulans]ACL62743.1 cytochrome c class I [Methylobacterium nodulans ORS 2060]